MTERCRFHVFLHGDGALICAPSYAEFCDDPKYWQALQEASSYNATGGGWRDIAHALREAVADYEQRGLYGTWAGIYQPYSIPPIGFQLEVKP